MKRFSTALALLSMAVGLAGCNTDTEKVTTEHAVLLIPDKIEVEQIQETPVQTQQITQQTSKQEVNILVEDKVTFISDSNNRDSNSSTKISHNVLKDNMPLEDILKTILECTANNYTVELHEVAMSNDSKVETKVIAKHQDGVRHDNTIYLNQACETWYDNVGYTAYTFSGDEDTADNFNSTVFGVDYNILHILFSNVEDLSIIDETDEEYVLLYNCEDEVDLNPVVSIMGMCCTMNVSKETGYITAVENLYLNTHNEYLNNEVLECTMRFYDYGNVSLDMPKTFKDIIYQDTSSPVTTEEKVEDSEHIRVTESSTNTDIYKFIKSYKFDAYKADIEYFDKDYNIKQGKLVYNEPDCVFYPNVESDDCFRLYSDPFTQLLETLIEHITTVKFDGDYCIANFASSFKMPYKDLYIADFYSVKFYINMDTNCIDKLEFNKGRADLYWTLEYH